MTELRCIGSTSPRGEINCAVRRFKQKKISPSERLTVFFHEEGNNVRSRDDLGGGNKVDN